MKAALKPIALGLAAAAFGNTSAVADELPDIYIGSIKVFDIIEPDSGPTFFGRGSMILTDEPPVFNIPGKIEIAASGRGAVSFEIYDGDPDEAGTELIGSGTNLLGGESEEGFEPTVLTLRVAIKFDDSGSVCTQLGTDLTCTFGVGVPLDDGTGILDADGMPQCRGDIDLQIVGSVRGKVGRLAVAPTRDHGEITGAGYFVIGTGLGEWVLLADGRWQLLTEDEC